MADSIGDIQLNINVNVRNASSINALNVAVSNLGKTSMAVTGATQKGTAAMQAQAKAANTLKGRLDVAEKQYDAIFRASYRLQNVGYGLISVAQKMFGELKSLTDAWGQFEFAINRAAGALQVWKNVGAAINPVYNDLINGVEALTKDLRIFPAADVARATYLWGSTSGQQVNTLQDLKSVLESVNPLMKVAALTETSYEAAIKGVYSILVQYHKPLSAVADITAKLFVVTQRTALEFPDLINSFKFIGPIAGVLGVSFEEVAQTLGALGDAGIRGTMAGRALRQVFIQLERPTAKAAGLLNSLFLNSKAFGKSFQSVVFPNGKFIGLTNTVNALAKALQHVNEAQAVNFLASVTTANEFSVIVPLVENQIKVLNGAADAYDNTKASVTDAASAASQFAKAWDLLSTSWVGIVGRLKAGAEVIKLTIGKEIAKALTPTIEAASTFLDKIERWVKMNPEVVSTIGRFAGSLAALAAVAGGLFILAGSLLGLYAAIGVLGRGFGPLLGIGAAALGVLASLAESIVANWTLVQREVVPAINSFLQALSGGRGTTAELKSEWDELHQTLRDVMNYIVRTAIHALKTLLDIMTEIAKSPLRGALASLGKTLALLFGLKALGGIISFKGALIALRSPLKDISTLVGAGALKLGFFSTIIVKLRTFLPALVAAFALLRKSFLSFEIVAIIATALTALFTITKGGIGTIIGLEAAIAAVTISFLAWKNGILTLNLLKLGVAGLKNGLVALSKASPLIIITALVSAFEFLTSNNVLGIGDLFDRLTHSLGDIKSEIEDIKFLAGSSAGAVGSAIDKANESTGHWNAQIATTTDRLIDLKNTAKDFGGRGLISVQREQQKINDLLYEQGKAAEKLWQSFKDGADKAGTSVKQYGSMVAKWLPSVGESFDNAKKAADEYFNYLSEDGTLSLSNAVQYWNKLIRDGLHPTIDKASFLKSFVSPDVLAQAGRDLAAQIDIVKARTALQAGNIKLGSALLLALKAQSSQYGPQIQSTVEDLLKGVPQGVQNVMDATDRIAAQAPGDMLAALISGFTALGDIGKTLQKALADTKSLTPGNLVKQLFGNPLKDLQTGFLSKQWGMHDWATAQLASVNETFYNSVVAAQDSGNTATLAHQIIKQYTGKNFTNAFGKDGKKLSPELKAAVQEWVDWAYTELGLTPPSGAATTTVTTALKKNLPKWLQDEFAHSADDTKTPKTAGQLAIEDATKGMMDAWNKGGSGGAAFLANVSNGITKSFDLDLHNGGYNTVKSWVNGAQDAWTKLGYPVFHVALRTISKLVVGESPPPEGPLKDIDKGGYNIMKAWGGGILAGGKYAATQASIAANAVQSAMVAKGSAYGSPTLNFEHNNTRVVKVMVDVSSKDGSIDGLNMKVLGDSIRPDLVRELEHIAATV